MVGKTPIKKQLVSRHERSSESIRIPDDLLSEKIEEWKEFLQNMNQANNSTEQNKLIQGVKRKFRTVLLDKTRDQIILRKLLEYFLFLYLHPTFFVFRTSLEWIVSCTRDLVEPWGKTLIQESISVVSNRVWESLLVEVGRDTEGLVAQAVMQRWIVTLNALVTLDREFDWINNATSHDFTRHDLIWCHARFLSSLLPSEEGPGKSLLVAMENIRFLSLATDVMRNMGSLLRPSLEVRRGHSLDGLDRIAHHCHSLLQQVDYSASKDLVANSAILLAILHLLSSEEQDNRVLPAFIDLVLQPAQSHPRTTSEVVEVVRALSSDVVMKSAFLRALFTLSPVLPSSDVRWLEGSEVVGFMVGLALQGDSFTQLFHLHSLSLYLHTLHSRGVSEGEVFVGERLAPRLWPVIKGGWKHPNRLITHIIPDIFQSFLFLLASTATSEEVQERQWRRCIEEVMSMASFHRSRYEALTRLLSHLSAKSLLHHRPHLLEELLNAVHDRNIASSVSSLFLLLCQKIDEEEESQEAAEATRRLLRQSLCQALASDVAAVRANISDYLLPELCNKVRTVFAPFSLLCFFVNSSPPTSSEGEGWLWAVVQLVWQCKLSVGAADYALLEKSEEVEVVQVRERVFHAMMSAAVHLDDSLRLMTLQAISASLKTTMPLYESEVVLMQRSLTYSLKTSEVDDCAKLNRAVKQWLLRAKLSNVAVYESLMKWLFSLLSEDWIPTDTGDLPVDKEFSLLTILSIMIEVGTNNSSSNPALPVLDAITQTLLSRHCIVPRLLLTFLSNYEKSRRLAHDLLAQLPSPWLSYNHSDGLNQLWKWTESLLTSAKLKESNAGAQLTSLLFQKYALHLGWCVFSEREIMSKDMAVKSFISHLTERCEEVLGKLKEVFRDLQLSYLSTTPSDQNTRDNQEKSGVLGFLGNFPLAHGYLLALRYCSAFLLNKSQTPSGVTSEVSRELVQRIYSLALVALSSGMEVIAHPPHSEEDEVLEGAKGPLGSSVAYSMAATYVNTNSFSPMDGETGELGGNGDDTTEEGMGAQRAIVAAWLLVKESASLLAALAPAHDHLTTEDLTTIGDSLLDALGRLKHMGAISETYTALQSVATTFLRYGNKQPTLSALPQLYLERLITRLNQQQQVFILRRSAGFAFSFLALLHAEPLNAQPILLQYTMRHLVDIVERGTSPKGVEEGLWKLSVHALNVIRSILLDSAFHGKELDIFIPRIMQFIILGFSSPIWSIRNSSMMSFSAIVQRMILRKEQKKSAFSMALQHQSSLSLVSDHLTVSSVTNLYPLIPSVPSTTLSALDDSDSNEEGSSKKDRGPREVPDIGGTMTIAEFFKRFPSLLSPLLSLLSEEVQQRIPASDIAVEEKRRVLSESADRHSLYAILLLFSKFTLLINHQNQREGREEENEDKEVDIVTTSSSQSEEGSVSDFVTLVEHCLLHHTNPLIRAVAAKAFTKLIPVHSFLTTALKKATTLVSDLQREGVIINANEVHGRLLQITALLTQYTNYRTLYPSTSSPSSEEVRDDEEVLRSFHTYLRTCLYPFALDMIMKSLHPVHSLALVQLLQQYAALLVSPAIASDSRLQRRKMMEEIQLMKYEFIAEYVIRTRRCYTLFDHSQPSKPLVLPPYFPYSLQHLLEILCREQPFLTLNTSSGVVVRWWDYVVGEEVLSRWLREGKIAVLSGALHYLTYHDPASFTEKEKKTIETFIRQVVDRIGFHLSRGGDIRGGRDDAVVTLLLVKVLHRYLLTWEKSQSIFTHDKRDLLIHQIFVTLLNPSNPISTNTEVTIEKLLEEIETIEERGVARVKELGDENQIPYLIQIVTVLIFQHEQSGENNRDSHKAVMMRLWKEVLLRGKRKLFSPSIRFAVVRAIELSRLLHSSSETLCCAPDDLCEEVAVKWSLALLTVELLQDDDEEVREAINHCLCTSVLNSDDKAVVTTVETKTTERMTALLGDILTRLDRLSGVSRERKVAVVRAMIEEFHLLYRELSLTVTKSEEVMRELVSPFVSPQSSQPQVIFEAEKGNLYINTPSLIRLLQSAIFHFLAIEELSSEMRELFLERWLFPWVEERWNAVRGVLAEVQRQEREGVARTWKEMMGESGRGSAVFQFFDLRIRFLAKWCERSKSLTSPSFSAVIPPHIKPEVIGAEVMQSIPFLSTALWLEEESKHSLFDSFKF